MVPPIVAVKMVGVLPKSLSGPICDEGTSKEAMKDRSVTFSSTMATAVVSFCKHEPPLPVAKYRVLFVVSIETEPQTLAPTQPLGTTLKVFSMVPVAGFRRNICACTSGQSPQDRVE